MAVNLSRNGLCDMVKNEHEHSAAVLNAAHTVKTKKNEKYLFLLGQNIHVCNLNDVEGMVCGIT